MGRILQIKWIILFVIFFEIYAWPISLILGSRQVVLLDDLIAVISIFIISVYILIEKKIRWANLNLPLFFFMIAMVFSAFINSVEIDVALVQLRSYMLMIVFYYLIVWGKISNEEIISCIKIILILFVPVFLSGVVEIIYQEPLLVQYDRYGREFEFSEGFRLHTTIGNPTDYSNFAMLLICILLPMIAIESNAVFSRNTSALLALLIFISMLFAASRGPLISLAVSFGVVLLVSRALPLKRFLHIFGFFLLLIILFGDTLTGRTTEAVTDLISSGGFQERTDYRLFFLLKSIQIFLDYPFFGVGPGRYGGWVSVNYSPSAIYEMYNFTTWDISSIDMFWPHILVELGMLGCLAYIGIFIRSLFFCYKLYIHESSQELKMLCLISALMTVAIGLSGLFSMVLENQMTLSLFLIMLGFTEKFASNKGKALD